MFRCSASKCVEIRFLKNPLLTFIPIPKLNNLIRMALGKIYIRINCRPTYQQNIISEMIEDKYV